MKLDTVQTVNLFQGYIEYKNEKPIKGWLRKGSTNIQRKERSRISSFSAQSRKRLHRECLKVRFQENMYFVTLTFQNSAVDMEDKNIIWKDDLHTLRLRLVRSLPKLSALWKLEFTKLGYPHYHLLTHCPDLCGTELRNIIRAEWLKITGSGSRGRYRHAVKVDAIGNLRAITRYMSKYISKDACESKIKYVGRYWGYFNKKCFPRGELQKREFTQPQLDYIRRILSCVYVPEKYNDVKANLSNTNNGFGVYLPFACQRQIIDPLNNTKIA